ncbi:MAG: hypothetical protein ACRDC4_11220, partial [Plesiomonas sp.]
DINRSPQLKQARNGPVLLFPTRRYSLCHLCKSCISDVPARRFFNTSRSLIMRLIRYGELINY